MTKSSKDSHTDAWRSLMLLLLPLTAAACAEEADMSTAEVQNAAKERIQRELSLSPDATLFTNVFVGREREGDLVMCGTVAGRRADGSSVAPRRFITGSESSGFLSFEPVGAVTNTTQPDMFAQWAELCAGAGGPAGGATSAAQVARRDRV